ncbi:MAG: 50S ribosomal protein L21 [Holosporaceae bacterium]|jgi:large subunit ribosomal protein L21|nr:50S ribosomal protein L21 [Holosporaceae bacterium]
MMLAVIRTGGQQYKVREGDFISVEKLPCEIGSCMEISDVLMLENDGKVEIGDPIVAGAVVKVSVADQKRRKTVLIFKKRRRKNYRRKNGHRQPVTVLKIGSISYNQE